MKTILSAICALFLHFTALAQLENIQFRLGTNLAVLPNYEEEIGDTFVTDPVSGFQDFVPAYTLSEKYTSSPGFSVAVNPVFKLSEKWSLRSGVTVDYLSFKRILDTSNSPDPVNENSVDPVRIINLNIPLEIQYKLIEQLSIGFGIQLSNRIYSKEVVEVVSPNTNGFGVEIEESEVTDGISFTDGQFWMSGNVNYLINQHFGAELSFKKSFHKIYSNDASVQGSGKVALLSLGIFYQLNFN